MYGDVTHIYIYIVTSHTFTFIYDVDGFNLFLGNITYVDFVSGLEGSCSSPESPCKYLHRAVEIANQNSKVVISGEQSLFKTIQIEKHITIESGSQKGIIVGKSNAPFAFTISPMINITLRGIKFKDISIISMSERSHVVVDDCAATGCKKTIFNLDRGISLYISNSSFNKMEAHVINKEDDETHYNKINNWRKVIIFINCTIWDTKGIYLKSHSTIV